LIFNQPITAEPQIQPTYEKTHLTIKPSAKGDLYEKSHSDQKINSIDNPGYEHTAVNIVY
jgi:hypothetical protein